MSNDKQMEILIPEIKDVEYFPLVDAQHQNDERLLALLDSGLLRGKLAQLVDDGSFAVDPAAPEPEGHLFGQLRAAPFHDVFDAGQCGPVKLLPGKGFNAAQVGLLGWRD